MEEGEGKELIKERHCERRTNRLVGCLTDNHEEIGMSL